MAVPCRSYAAANATQSRFGAAAPPSLPLEAALARACGCLPAAHKLPTGALQQIGSSFGFTSGQINAKRKRVDQPVDDLKASLDAARDRRPYSRRELRAAFPTIALPSLECEMRP
jgi:hypothetical protein